MYDPRKLISFQNTAFQWNENAVIFGEISTSGCIRSCHFDNGRGSQWRKCAVNIISLTSQWAPWRLKSPAYRLLAQPFVLAHTQETSILRVTGICEGKPPMIGGFPSQRASVAENVFIWWRHHDEISVSTLTSPLQTEHCAVSHFSISYNIDIRISISQIRGYRSDQRQRK